MNQIKMMQELKTSLNSLQHNVEMNKLSGIYISSSNNGNLSQYHLEFDKLIQKYTGFADDFKNELANFDKLLTEKLNDLHKQRELEIISNCSTNNDNNDNSDNNNNHIKDLIDNSTIVADIDSVSSINNINNNYNTSNQLKPQTSVTPPPPPPPPSPPVAPIIINKPKHISKPKAKPKLEPKPIQKPKPKASDDKKSKQNVQSINNKIGSKPKPKPKPKTAIKAAISPVIKEIVTQEYKYDPNNIEWEFNEVHRSSTVIYIGNLASYIKLGSIQFFIMKQFHVSMRQIEETKIKESSRGRYCLVRFRADVLLDNIQKYMNHINYRNQQFKLNKNNKNKSKQASSWHRKIYLKFNNSFWHYNNEYEMYNDPRASCKIFVKNFDILNDKCHSELSNIFMEFGNLTQDILIKYDSFNDPYCIIVFNNINDAILCCNTGIDFYGRILDMKYSYKVRL